MAINALNDLYVKDISRHIDGVVKADDGSNLRTEIEEYVFTKEISKGIRQLLETYNQQISGGGKTTSNGVWISGFFGSGKSHLLKMLAHLLGDVSTSPISRDTVMDEFVVKSEDEDDVFLTALLKKSSDIPAGSILFNIDQKANTIEKDRADALLGVFVRVFNEARGYFGGQPHIAKFEHDLDVRGILEDFRASYRDISGIDWTKGREYGFLEDRNIAEAYAAVTGINPDACMGLLDKYQKAYSISIEDFADDVAAWLDTQKEGYRLNFFVDEVGQFIGANTQLMLNLQTIAETLYTKCDGRAWIFVTSQEDMDNVLGDRTKSQANDFSKIQARFATRLKLQSAEVEEVISKRLLAKNEAGEAIIGSIYDEQKKNFRTLFDFSGDSRTFRNYQNKEHFVSIYPFIAYQFPLFQESIRGISDHNAFEGRHSSVGERSMLGVVQEVATAMGDDPLRTLASFDQWFEGIRTALKGSAIKNIASAEKNLFDQDGNLDELGIRVLKALFLVKYVDSFKSTLRNMTVLLLEGFDQSLPELEARIQKSLEHLERGTYIQRVGDTYEFLTDEEKQVEQEIKNTDVDEALLYRELDGMVFGNVLRLHKVTYYETGQTFVIGTKLDGMQRGRAQDITVHVVTPNSGFTKEEIHFKSMGAAELFVIMPENDRLMEDFYHFLRTDRYIKLQQGAQLTESLNRIINAKADINNQLKKELQTRMEQSLGQAILMIQGRPLDIQATGATSHVEEGIQDLIGRVYSNLSMLGTHKFEEQDVQRLLKEEDPAMLTEREWTPFEAPAEEILGFLQRRKTEHERVTLHGLMSHFRDKPYGWSELAVRVLVAYLFRRSKVSLRLDSNLLTRNNTANKLLNTREASRIEIEKLANYDRKKLENLRVFAQDFFAESAPPTSPLELAEFVRQGLIRTADDLKSIQQTNSYPFLSRLDEPISQIDIVVANQPQWFLVEFESAPELLDAKDDYLDKITSFVHGPQASIYKHAEEVLNRHSGNLSILNRPELDEQAEAVRALLLDEKIYIGRKSTELKAATTQLESDIAKGIDAQIEQALQEGDDSWQTFVKQKRWKEASEELRATVQQQYEQWRSWLETQKTQERRQVTVIYNKVEELENTLFPRWVDLLAPPVEPTASEDPEAKDPNGEENSKSSQSPAFTTVSISKVAMERKMEVISNADELDAYLVQWREHLLGLIRDGKQIIY